MRWPILKGKLIASSIWHWFLKDYLKSRVGKNKIRKPFSKAMWWCTQNHINYSNNNILRLVPLKDRRMHLPSKCRRSISLMRYQFWRMQSVSWGLRRSRWRQIWIRLSISSPSPMRREWLRIDMRLLMRAFLRNSRGKAKGPIFCLGGSKRIDRFHVKKGRNLAKVKSSRCRKRCNYLSHWSIITNFRIYRDRTISRMTKTLLPKNRPWNPRKRNNCIRSNSKDCSNLWDFMRT